MRKLLAGLLLTLPGAAPAATLIVDTGADTLLSGCTAAPGDCTLRGPITPARTSTVGPRSAKGVRAIKRRSNPPQLNQSTTTLGDFPQ